MSVSRVVLPGEKIPLPSTNIGPGLCTVPGETCDCAVAVVSTAGLLRETASASGGKGRKAKTWVDYSAKRVSRAS